MTDNRATIEQSVMDKIQSKEIPLVFDCAVSQAKYIGAILRSSLGRWCLSHAGTIPIPKILATDQLPFIRLVDEILESKDTDPDADTSHLEWEIDQLAYGMYGLTEEEVTAIERSLSLIHSSDEEEDAAIARAIDEAMADPENVADERTQVEFEDIMRSWQEESADEAGYSALL